MRQQFATAVTADGHQRQTARGLRQELRPGLAQHFVDQMGAGVDQRIGRRTFMEQADQPLAAPGQGFAERGDRLAAIGAQAVADAARGEDGDAFVFVQLDFSAHETVSSNEWPEACGSWNQSILRIAGDSCLKSGRRVLRDL